MRFKLIFPALLVLLTTRSVHAQAVKDLATLMPAKALVYAEIRQAGALAKEIGGLFKGSALSNVPDSLQKIRDRYPKNAMGWRLNQELGGAGMMLSPEVLAELGRVQGAAVAFTGLSENQAPEFLAVVLPGDSNAPGFFLRMAMTLAPTRKLETVEGVMLYGMEIRGETIPVFAMTSGALLVGSHAHVKNAVLRLKTKLDIPTLAENALFKEARKQIEEKPGLFTFVEPKGLLRLFENLPLAPHEKHVQAIIEKVLNPKAIRAVVQGWALDQGTLSFREVILLDPAEKSPILGVLPTRPVNLDLLQFAPKDAVFAAVKDNAGGEMRFQKLVSIIDSAAPEGFKFSDMIQGVETKLNVSLGKDILGQISAIGIAVGDPLKARTKTVSEIGPNFQSSYSTAEVPVVILFRANNPKAAEKLMKLVPTVVGAGRDLREPIVRKVEGRELMVLKVSKFEEFVYGREGATIVIGPFAGPVAKSLNAGAKRQGLLSIPQLAERLKETDKDQAVACVKLVNVIASFAMVRSQAMVKPRDFEDKKEAPKKAETKVTYSSPLDDPIIRELSKILNQEEFHVIGLRCTKDRIQLEGQAPGLRRLIPRLVDFAVEQMYRGPQGRAGQGRDN